MDNQEGEAAESASRQIITDRPTANGPPGNRTTNTLTGICHRMLMRGNWRAYRGQQAAALFPAERQPGVRAIYAAPKKLLFYRRPHSPRDGSSSCFFAGVFFPSATADVIEEAHHGQNSRSDDNDDLGPRCRPPNQRQHQNRSGQQKAAETQLHDGHLRLESQPD